MPTATLVLFRVKNKQTRATSDDVIMAFYCHFLNKFRRAVTTFSYAFGQVFACCFGFFSYFLTNFDQILTGWKNSFSPRKLQPNMDFLRNNKTLLKTDVKLKDSFFYCILEWRSNSKSNWTYLYTTDAPPPATMVQIRPFLLRTVSFNEAPLFASRSATKASFLMKKERKVKTYKCSYHLKPYSSYIYQKINWQKKTFF